MTANASSVEQEHAAKRRERDMKRKKIVAPDIDLMIIELRGQKVILDASLAAIYGVPTKRLNEQVRRNIDRFPNDFAFQVTREEWQQIKAPGTRMQKEAADK